MRISDWSSDVCSSDLSWQMLPCPARDLGRRQRARHARDLAAALEQHQRRDAADAETGAQFGLRLGIELAQPQDRKSVVEGKSVSVRVDLGGRLIIKKKTQLTNTKYMNDCFTHI